MSNPLDDQHIRRAIEASEKLRRNPAYQALERHEEALRNNPALRSIRDATERQEEMMRNNPAMRAALEAIERRDRDPAFRTLMEKVQREIHISEPRSLNNQAIFEAFNARFMAVEELVNEYDKNFDEPPPVPAKVTDSVELVKELTPELIAHLKSSTSDLEKLDAYVAEHLVAELLRANGFHEVRLVGRDSATSADVYAVTRLDPIGIEVRIFVEVKWWKDRVGIEVFNQVLGAMLSEQPTHGWHAAMIVSAAGFTKFEKWTADEISMKNVLLKDCNDLTKWLSDYNQSPNGLWLPKPVGE